MTSQTQPIKLWGKGGPNPPKISMLLEELGLSYDIVPIPLTDVKNPEYVKINPNGRVPAIHDPSNDLTLWESGAIIEYLIDSYDKDHRISFAPGTPESWHAKQWLFLQVSGQGPYYGQAAWFMKYHPEKLPSATERYVKEVNRITGVLETQLEKQQAIHGGGGDSDGPWLVGNKFSFADLAFVSYQVIVGMIFTKDEYDDENYPHVKEWLGKMTSRKAIKTVIENQFGH